MKIVKSLLVIASFAFIVSCGKNPPPPPPPGANNHKLTEADFNTVLDKMKDDGEIEDKEFKKIKEKLEQLKIETSKQRGNNNSDDTDTLTVNSFDLSEAFRIDRAIAWAKYGNKKLLITDMLIYDVYNVDFTKKVSAYPYSPTQKKCGFHDDARMFTFKGEPIYNNEVQMCFIFELTDPKEMDKVGMLDYEAVVENDFKKSVSMYATLTACKFSPGVGEDKNLKTNWNFITLEPSEIVSDKKK